MMRALACLALAAVMAPPAPACTPLPLNPLWSKNPRSRTALFPVQIGGKIGYINAAGKMVIAPQYELMLREPGDGDFVDGLAYVRKLSRGLVIDETGRVVKEWENEPPERSSEGMVRFSEEKPRQRSGRTDLFRTLHSGDSATLPARP